MCVTTYISFLAYKLFHNQFSFMLGKHENTFPLLAGCKIAFFLYHLLTKRILYLHSCSSVDPVLTQEPAHNWQLELKMRSWMLPLYTCITCVCTANKQTLKESRICLQKYWFTDHSLTGIPASQCCCQTSEGTNQHQLCWHLLKGSICPRALYDKNLSPKRSSIPWWVV